MQKRSYEILLSDSTGKVIRPIGNALSVKWVVKENKVGTCVLDLPVDNCIGEGWSRDQFGEDYLIDIWRRNVDGTRKRVGGSSFFVQNIWGVRESGIRKIRIECDDGKALMSRRINAWRSTNIEQDYSGARAKPLDNFIASVFEKTFGLQEMKYTTTNVPVFGYSYAEVRDLDRELEPTWLGQVQVNGPATTLTSWNVTNHQTALSLFQKAVDYGASKSENIFWTVENNSAGATPFMQVKIYVGLRGSDRSKSVILSDFDGITDYKIGIAYRDTLRRVYAGGKKSNRKQRTAEANSPDFPGVLATNPWALREGYVAANSDVLEDVQAAADAELQKKLARKTASGSIQDTETYSYGRDFEIGDKISVQIDGETFIVFLDSEEGTLENGIETLTIGFNSDTYNYVSAASQTNLFRAADTVLFDLYRRIQDLQSIVRQHEILFADYDLG